MAGGKISTPSTMICGIQFQCFSVSMSPLYNWKYKTCPSIQQKSKSCWNQKMSKNLDNKTHTLKASSEKIRFIITWKWLSDIWSHQTDEEQCAQKIVVFLCFCTGSFCCADFITGDCKLWIRILTYLPNLPLFQLTWCKCSIYCNYLMVNLYFIYAI